MRRRMALTVVIGVGLIGLAGCCTGCGRKVWVEKTQELSFETSGVNKVAIETHNGGVRVTGGNEAAEAQVTVKVKAGGRTEASAEACMDAIELVSTAKDGTHHLGWKWRTVKHVDWAANVGFSVTMPERLATTVRTHNGGITVEHVMGSCNLETHNGGVDVSAGAAPLSVSTHNGGIKAVTSGERVALVTHNGGIKLDARGNSRLGGQVETHNGGIRVALTKDTSAELSCRTANGSIHCDVPWNVKSMTRHEAMGTIGQGGTALRVETHNGGIAIVDTDGK